MYIEIDCNNDRINIQHRGQTINLKIHYPTEHCKVLEEIFNLLDIPDMIIEQISEDERRTIGEW